MQQHIISDFFPAVRLSWRHPCITTDRRRKLSCRRKPLNTDVRMLRHLLVHLLASGRAALSVSCDAACASLNVGAPVQGCIFMVNVAHFCILTHASVETARFLCSKPFS